jgi:hypothetical protein
LVIGAIVVMVLLKTGSYDQCMLDAMRGQPQSTISNAYNLCRERYPEKK